MVLERVGKAIDRAEETLLVLLLSVMILVAFLQIVLRNVFTTGLTWGDSIVRNLVLWVGFIGATLATREGKHINIDLVSRWVSPRAKGAIEFITHLFSFFICGLLTWAALKFLKNEAHMGNVAFLGIASWIPATILLATFALMACRFGLRSLGSLWAILKKGGTPVPSDET